MGRGGPCCLIAASSSAAPLQDIESRMEPLRRSRSFGCGPTSALGQASSRGKRPGAGLVHRPDSTRAQRADGQLATEQPIAVGLPDVGSRNAWLTSVGTVTPVLCPPPVGIPWISGEWEGRSRDAGAAADFD